MIIWEKDLIHSSGSRCSFEAYYLRSGIYFFARPFHIEEVVLLLCIYETPSMAMAMAMGIKLALVFVLLWLVLYYCMFSWERLA